MEHKKNDMVEELHGKLHDYFLTQNWYALGHLLRESHPADAAEWIETLEPEDQGLMLRLGGLLRRAEIFSYLPDPLQHSILRSITPEQLTRLVTEMRPDDRTRLLEDLPVGVSHALLGRLPSSEVKTSLALLGYPEETAGRHMTPEFAVIAPDMTVAQALDEIRRTGRGKETLNIVYVVDREGKLVADVRLGSLVLADPDIKVIDIHEPGLIALLDSTPVEDVLQAFEKYDRVALPVVDEQGRMLGIITIDDVLDVASEESTRDIQKMGGMAALDEPYTETGLWAMVKKRGVWLVVLFLGGMFTATAMTHYQGEIQKAVVLAFFVPVIISAGGNSGSQAASLITRALALREIELEDWWMVCRRELISGLSLGVGVGVVGFFVIILGQKLGLKDFGPHFALLGATMLASLIGVISLGNMAGSMLPFLLRRMGLDPAASSAPFVATLVDVTGLVIYFQVASWVLKGTIL